ncbi:MAG TPA: hypothetical protein VIJ38_03310, partial [Acidobacteriaceae bacterium]
MLQRVVRRGEVAGPPAGKVRQLAFSPPVRRSSTFYFTLVDGFDDVKAHMATLSQLPERSPQWSADAIAMAAQAKVLSGHKLEQLAVRLQRHRGRRKEACWRLIIQHGIKGRQDYRRWTEAEFETVREELVKRSIEEVAKKV